MKFLKHSYRGKKYDHAFAETLFKTPSRAENNTHAFNLYIIQVPAEKRKGLYDFLRANKIISQVLYIPTHHALLPPVWLEGDIQVAEDYYKYFLALPIYPRLTDEEQDWVIEKVREFMSV